MHVRNDVHTTAFGSHSKNTKRAALSHHPVARLGMLVVAAHAVAMTLPSIASAQVTVLQVEAGNILGSPAYSPVEFGTNTVTTSGTYPGITSFNRMVSSAVTGASLSDHASFVAAAYYGTGTVGATAINKVYVDAATTLNSVGAFTSLSFFTETLKVPYTTNVVSGTTTYTATASMNGSGPVPAVLGNGIRVSSHAYVFDTSTAIATEIVRRADYMIARDNHVWVAGAVNGTGYSPSGTIVVAWQTRNGIAVRGDAGQTPFDPSLGNAGRKHADVWYSQLASPSTGTVAGFAAALIKQGQTLGSTPAQDARVIKSVIMTGADKTAAPGTFNTSGGTWQPTTQNNLDGNAGTGKADYNSSLAILNGGQRTYSTTSGNVSGSTVSAGTTPSTSAKGWGLGSVATSGVQSTLLHFDGPVTGFAATLNWYWTSYSFSNDTQLSVSDALAITPDLAFDLRPVTWNGSQYVLGSTIANTTGRSLISNATGSTNDNVEHLYITSSSGAIAPGTYALVVTGASTQATTAALSYTATAGSTPRWQTNANGTLSTGSNWLGSFAPNGVSVKAIFPNIITAARTIDINTATTLGGMTFGASNTYTLSSSTGSSLTLTNGNLSPFALIDVTAGAPVLSLPVITPNATSVAFSGSATSLTVQSIANSGQLTVSGLGTLRIPNSITGTGSVVIGAASSLLISNAGSGSTNVNVLTQSALTLTGVSGNPANAVIQGNLFPASGARASKARVSVVGTLSLGNDGAALASRTYFDTLDLQSNDLILRSNSETEVRRMVASWWNNGLKDGKGLTSSLAGTGLGADQLTTLAVVLNNNGSGGTRFSSFDGVTGLVNTDVIVKYTYIGDLDLSGTVDNTDLNMLVNGIRNNLTGWWNGDTNYDGVVNATDYSNLLTVMRFKVSGQSFEEGAPAGTGVIPEPAAMGLLLAGLPMLSRRRR